MQYLRDDAELASVCGEHVVAETRVNPDGTLDISKWGRPQHDGPPLRALTLLRWARSTPLDAEASALLSADLEFTLRHWHEPSFDIWEEEKGLHYYTLRVSAAALGAGGEPEAAKEILRSLDGAWLQEENLDVAVILATIHADGEGDHSVHDPRMQSTLAALERHFGEVYPINRGRSAPALGRYPGDVYYEGGAWYVATLAAAEFCYRAGSLERGDAFLETVRAFTPASGEMSEQFDPRTGAQKSARHLAWSYAAFISCVAARADLRRPTGAASVV